MNNDLLKTIAKSFKNIDQGVESIQNSLDSQKYILAKKQAETLREYLAEINKILEKAY